MDIMHNSPAREAMEKALTCLFLEAPQSVCHDVGAKVRNREAELQHALSQSQSEIKNLRAAVVGINIALVRDEHPDAAAKLAINIRNELQF